MAEKRARELGLTIHAAAVPDSAYDFGKGRFDLVVFNWAMPLIDVKKVHPPGSVIGIISLCAPLLLGRRPTRDVATYLWEAHFDGQPQARQPTKPSKTPQNPPRRTPAHRSPLYFQSLAKFQWFCRFCRQHRFARRDSHCSTDRTFCGAPAPTTAAATITATLPARARP